MTLTIQSEEDEQRQLKVEVEVPEDRVQKQMRQTARSLSKQLKIPGFRRGKVPYNVLVHRIGEDTLRAEAVEAMLENVVEEALEEVDATPYRQPSLDDIELNPLVLKITIPLLPSVELGDYREIRMEVDPVEISEDAVENAMYQIQTKHQVLEDVERPAEEGDLVTLSGEGRIEEEEGQEIWRESEIALPMDKDKAFPKVPFVENIVGLKADEEKEFTFTFGEDYDDEELVGKPAIFQVKIIKVQSRELPELTDELAKEEGDYESLDDLRKALRNELEESARRDSRTEMLDDFTTELIADSKIVYPPAAVELELDRVLEETKGEVSRSGWQWKDYLQLQGETEDSLRQAWREGAEDRLERGFALQEFVSAELLTVDSKEIDNALEDRIKSFGAEGDFQEELRKIFTQGQGLEVISNDVLVEKVKDRIEEIISGNGPDLDALRAEMAKEFDEEE